MDIMSAKSEHFNSHPRKEDDFLLSQMDLHLQYFNSHPHKEDDGDNI